MKKRAWLVLLSLFIIVGLAGCGGKSLNGEYVEEFNGTVMKFQNNHVSVAGYTATYKIEDGIITVTNKDNDSMYGVYDAENDIITIEGETYRKKEATQDSEAGSGDTANVTPPDTTPNDAAADKKDAPQPATEDKSDILSKISVVAKPTLDDTVCVFITNNSESVIDELEIQIRYTDAQGTIVDVDENGHDMVLPGYTVVSRMNAPNSYVDFETDVSIKLGVNPSYENRSEQVSISANQGEDCVIVQITNNCDITIDQIEYVVVLYKNDDIVEVCYPQGVYDVGAGKTVVEKESTYWADYNRFEVFLNQAHIRAR